MPSISDITTALLQRYSPYLQSHPNAYITLSHSSKTPQGQLWQNEQIPLANLKSAAQTILQEWGPLHIYSTLSIFARPPQSQNGKGTSEEVLGSKYLWVDLDIYRAPIPKTKEQALAALKQFTPKPTQVIDSGQGLYALWRLTSLCEDQEAIEQRNRWLQQALAEYGADHCHNWDRVLRVPGSLNAKTDPAVQCRVIYEDLDAEYALSDFYTATAREEYPALEIDPEPIPSNFVTQVYSLLPVLWRRIESEGTARASRVTIKSNGFVDRSQNDFYIACRLLDRPFIQSPGVVASVLSHPTWFSGEKFRDAETGGWGYVERTISAAAAVINAKQAQAEKMGQLYVDTGNGPKFSPFRATQVFVDEFHFRYYHRSLYYYNEALGIYSREEDRYIPQLLGAAIGDSYWSKYAEEVQKQLEQNAPSVDHTDDRWLNLQNGLLNLDTDVFIEHQPGVFTTTQIPVRYIPYEEISQAAIDRLDEFVESIVGEDGLLLWWEFVGHCLIDRVITPGVLFLRGLPRTGKSQILMLLKTFLGAQNTSSVDINQLTDESFTSVSLVDKKANICFDTTTEMSLDRLGFLKRLVGGETIMVAAKYQQPFETDITAKCFFATNRAINVKFPDEGLYRRFFSIQCSHVWGPEDAGYQAGIGALLGASDDIRAAMLHRALEGLARLRRQNEYTMTKSATEEREQMREDSDTVLTWWKECTTEDIDFRVKASVVDMEYQRFTQARGHLPVSDTRFRQRTEELVKNGILAGPLVKKHAQLTGSKEVRSAWVGRRITQTVNGSLTVTLENGKSLEIQDTSRNNN